MEAVGKVCLLVAEDDVSSKCWFGLIRARSEYLNLGRNRDSKSSISREGLRNVLWLISGGPMPQNFWSGVPAADIAAIMDSRCGATERLRRLFSMIKATPISRDVVCGVARQLDYMKRIRKNGGARDPLAREGIAVLSGNYDAELISALGLPRCAPDAFISYAATGCEDRGLLRDGGHPVCDGSPEANP